MEQGEKLYEIIADNIRKERKKLHISQGILAERAQVSIDTIKSIERGRRSMSLDTYLRIVEALDTTPLALMNREQTGYYIDRFVFMTKNCSSNQVEFVLHIVEELLKGQDYYLKE